MDRRLLQLYGLVFCLTLMMGMALPLVPQYLRQVFLASPLTVGIVVGVYGLLQIVGRLPLGTLSDRIGRRASLSLAFAASLLGGLFLVLAPSPWWILPAEALLGVATGTFWVSANSYVPEIVPRQRVGRAMTWYAVAMDAGFLVGAPMGGVADAVGYRRALTLILWAAMVGLALSVTLPEAPRRPGPTPVEGVYRRAWSLLHDPDLLVSAGGTFAYALLLGFVSGLVPYYLQGLGYTALAIGLLFSLRSLLSMASRAPVPRLLDALGPRSVLYGGTLLGAVAMAAFPRFHGPLAVGFLFALVGAAMGLTIPANLTLVGLAAPPDERGLANGIYGTMVGVGSTTGTLVFGAVADAAGFPAAFLGVGALSAFIVAGLALTHGTRSPARDDDGVPLPAPPTEAK